MAGGLGFAAGVRAFRQGQEDHQRGVQREEEAAFAKEMRPLLMEQAKANTRSSVADANMTEARHAALLRVNERDATIHDAWMKNGVYDLMAGNEEDKQRWDKARNDYKVASAGLVMGKTEKFNAFMQEYFPDTEVKVDPGTNQLVVLDNKRQGAYAFKSPDEVLDALARVFNPESVKRQLTKLGPGETLVDERGRAVASLPDRPKEAKEPEIHKYIMGDGGLAVGFIDKSGRKHSFAEPVRVEGQGGSEPDIHKYVVDESGLAIGFIDKAGRRHSFDEPVRVEGLGPKEPKVSDMRTFFTTALAPFNAGGGSTVSMGPGGQWTMTQSGGNAFVEMGRAYNDPKHAQHALARELYPKVQETVRAMGRSVGMGLGAADEEGQMDAAAPETDMPSGGTVSPAQAFVPPAAPPAAPSGGTPADKGGYGKRVDGTEKGSGWLGELKMKDGSGRVATEISVGVELDGKNVEIPAIVPTLDAKELDYLLKGGDPRKSGTIMDKAVSHAKAKMASGQSPFKNSGASSAPASSRSATPGALDLRIEGDTVYDGDGNAYKMAPDGTVTIKGRRYKAVAQPGTDTRKGG